MSEYKSSELAQIVKNGNLIELALDRLNTTNDAIETGNASKLVRKLYKQFLANLQELMEAMNEVNSHVKWIHCCAMVGRGDLLRLGLAGRDVQLNAAYTKALTIAERIDRHLLTEESIILSMISEHDEFIRQFVIGVQKAFEDDGQYLRDVDIRAPEAIQQLSEQRGQMQKPGRKPGIDPLTRNLVRLALEVKRNIKGDDERGHPKGKEIYDEMLSCLSRIDKRSADEQAMLSWLCQGNRRTKIDRLRVILRENETKRVGK